MAEHQRRPFRRRHYFINRRLQGRFTIYFLILGLFIALSTSMFIWHFSAEEFDRFIYRSHLSPIAPWEVVFPVMMKAGVVSTAMLILSAFFCAHVIFKRLRAKFLVFNDTLREIDKGNLTLANLDDGIQELNEPLKLFVEMLKQDIMSLQATQKGMKNLVEKMEQQQDKAAVLHDIEGLGKVFAKKMSTCRLIMGD
jgi:hypothetical protein